MRSVFVVVFSILIVFISNCSKGEVMEITKPSYYLKLKMRVCPRTIAVNGFIIEEDLVGTSNYSEYPINPYIKNGDNELMLIVAPEAYMKTIADNHPNCEVEVRVRGTHNGDDVDYLVSNIVFTPDYSSEPESLIGKSMQDGSYQFSSDGNTVAERGASDAVSGKIVQLPSFDSGGGVPFKRAFSANVPFPEWEFFSGEKFFDYPMTNEKFDAMEAVVWPMVLEQWDLFENKEIDKILAQFELRSKEYDQAFYRQEGETQKLIRESLEARYKEGLPLDRLDSDYMQLTVNYDGKVVTMKDAGTGVGTVLFYDKELDSNYSYDIYWIKKDGKWIIAR